MKLNISDHGMATSMWITVVIVAGSLSAVPGLPAWLPLAQFGLVLAVTINLLHARYVRWNAGEAFARRVREVLADDLVSIDSRMGECERLVADVKEAQIAIAGQFRGRGHP